MRTRLRVLGAATIASLVAAIAVPLLTTSQAEAARFTGGNLVVYRVGSGAALSNAAAPVFLDEYGPTGAKVQSVALPTSAAEGNARLTAAGQSRSEGLIDRSADGRFVVVTGYDAAVGTTGPGNISLTASNPATVGRVVGLVDANGTVDTTTVLTGNNVAKIIRSATTTNGERLWAAGGNGGIQTATIGSTTATVAAGAAGNFSSLTIQGGQLFTSGILANRLAALGSGTPTSGALTDLGGLPGNLLTYGYAFADLTSAGYGGTTLDTVYLANSSERGGTVDKYRWNGSAWASAGYVDVDGATGIVANVTGGSVSLAVTTPTQLITLTDANGPATTFTPSAPAVLATAAAGTEFRGVALAPTSAAGPSVYLHAPGVGESVALTAPIAVTAYVDSPVGVGTVSVKVGKSAIVKAKRSGHLWTAKVPVDALKPGNSTVRVTATDSAKAVTTLTRAIKLTKSNVPKGALGAGTFAPSAKQIKYQGTWKKYTTKKSPNGKGKTSTAKGASAKTKVYGSKLTLTFDRSAKSGKVKVVVDGKATTLDLFDKSGKPLKKTWKFKGKLKVHKIQITVLGTKGAKSTGTAVSLAALKVKA